MTIDSLELAARLGTWHNGTGPLYRQLADALRLLLESGELMRGTALPPERTLARSLAVSRTTVTGAYGTLRSEGWLDARQGSATRVAVTRHSPFGAHRANGIFATLVDNSNIDIDLTVNVPDASPVVAGVFENIGTEVEIAELTAGHGYFPAGHPSLRTGLAEMLSNRGLLTTPDEVLVTTGAQQAVALAIEGLTRAGDRVAVEETTYPGALDAIAAHGLYAVPLEMTANGVSIDAVRTALATEPPKLVYLIPTFHNPTGAVLSEDDRRRVLRLARAHSITVIDDMTLADLDYDEPAPAPMAALDPEATVVTIGSLSKLYWGGLRVGWIRAPEPIVTHLQGLKVSADMGSPAPIQVLASQMLRHHAAARTWRHEQLRRSFDAFSTALETHVPEWEWTAPRGGPQLWVRLPDTDATAFSQLALREGIALVPGPLLAANGRVATDRLRLPLYPPPEVAHHAIERLAHLWRR